MNDYDPAFDFTSPTQIAEALEAVAARLRRLSDMTVAPTHVSLELWVNGATTTARPTVDLLGYTVTGRPGCSADVSSIHDMYSTPRPQHLVGVGTRVLTVTRRKPTSSNASVVQISGRTY
ncbi:hypothetical protein FB566_2370 [Stackebrandtia endophytica]|uniref:Uncharacterized protein n=1 Tax=Stackebrandtia endophytica TaxID=1496996 RepID=A0A543AWA6_9ACTN|nr:hypothetical protein [Stackebrandtia endophytica]TQL76830.1 hypothetical protein FB566_2370 [Stackebrandtia endophytica]